MRYQFVSDQQQQYSVTALCHALDLTRSGYYAWRNRPVSRRVYENERLMAEMQVIHRQYKGRYGSPRMTAELRSRGLPCGEHRVARLMRQSGIRAKAPRRFRVTTDSQHRLPVAPNLLNRSFAVARPNEVWASDITCVWTTEGWLYVAVILDLHSRLVVGWSTGSRRDTGLVLLALDRAIRRRRLETSVLHHSDRGSEYASEAYQQYLARHGITCSMSRKGNCWDNAVVESFMATLKKESIHGQRFETRQAAQVALFEYIEVFYNRVRRHSTLGQLSPVEFEQSADPLLKTCPLF